MNKTILLSIRNGLVSDGIVSVLRKKSEEGRIVQERNTKLFVSAAEVYKPDIVVVEVKGSCPNTLAEWSDRIHEMKKSLSKSKVAILVDDENYPETAELVKRQKANGEIDAFFYESSGLNYLVDAIVTL